MIIKIETNEDEIYINPKHISAIKSERLDCGQYSLQIHTNTFQRHLRILDKDDFDSIMESLKSVIASNFEIFHLNKDGVPVMM